MMGQLLFVLAVIVLVGMAMVATAIRVVPEHQRFVVFRLGRPLDKPKGPGLVVLIPILDRAAKVDLREQEREVSNQTATTKDYKPVTFAFRWHHRVLDPMKYVLEIGNPEAAVAGVASKKIGELIHEVDAVDLAIEREQIRFTVNSHLDKITGQWGIKITKFEFLGIVVDDSN